MQLAKGTGKDTEKCKCKQITLHLFENNPYLTEVQCHYTPYQTSCNSNMLIFISLFKDGGLGLRF